MPPVDSIRSYLVGLGWAIDDMSYRKFDAALKRSDVAVSKFAKSAVKDFTLVGGAFVAAAAAVTAGTVAMMSSVAKQDMGYQLFARRMFMGTDAARKMKMATDALGYSLEEIIWGPPELAERYRALIKDESQMLEMLGSDRGERAFRKIRDIEFQFTRMGPAFQVFAMRLTEDVMNKMFGGSESLEKRLKGFVDWFESPQGLPVIADKISNVLVPAFRKLGSVVGGIIDNLGLFSAFLGDHPLNPLTYNYGLVWDKNKGVNSNMNTVFGSTKDEMIGKAARAAGKYGGPEAVAEFLALIEQESGFNPNAVNQRSGATGLGQIMQFNAHGKNLFDPDANLEIAARMFFEARKRHGGDVRGALGDYYGNGKPKPGEPTLDQYYDQYTQKYNKWKSDSTFGGASLQNQSYSPSMGGVTINIAQPGATSEQIHRAVMDGIDKANRLAAQRAYAQRQGVFA